MASPGKGRKCRLARNHRFPGARTFLRPSGPRVLLDRLHRAYALGYLPAPLPGLFTRQPCVRSDSSPRDGKSRRLHFRVAHPRSNNQPPAFLPSGKIFLMGNLRFSAVLSSKGQVVIPQAVRKALGLRAGDRLDVDLNPDGQSAVLRSRQRRDWRALRGAFGLVNQTTTEILAKARAEELRSEKRR